MLFSLEDKGVGQSSYYTYPIHVRLKSQELIPHCSLCLHNYYCTILELITERNWSSAETPILFIMLQSYSMLN